jgi:hypothetical protein
MADWLIIIGGGIAAFAFLWVSSFSSRGKQFDIMRNMSKRSDEPAGDPKNPVVLKPLNRKVWYVLGSIAAGLAAVGFAKSDYMAEILKGQAS